MTDTDQTNIYSYKGTDYTGDLMAYLTAQGLIIRTIEVDRGSLFIVTDTHILAMPQYIQWNGIAKHIKGER